MGIDSFADTYSSCSDHRLRHLDKNFRSRDLTQGKTADAYLCGDGRTVYYVDMEARKPFRMDAARKAPQPEELTFTYHDLYPMDDGKNAYFRTRDRQLYYWDGENEPVLVSEFCMDAYPSPDGRTIVYTQYGPRPVAMMPSPWRTPVYIWAARDGKPRLLVETEGVIKRWNAIDQNLNRPETTNTVTAFTLHMEDADGNPMDFYFEEPWKYGALWRNAAPGSAWTLSTT